MAPSKPISSKRSASITAAELPSKKRKSESTGETDANEGLSVELRAAYERNAKESRLLRVPGEIRNKIYGYVFDERQEVAALTLNISVDRPGLRRRLCCGPYNDTGKSFENWHEHIALTQVCRQLRAETELMPYKLNTFQICNELEFNGFLQQLSEEKKNAITAVSFGSRISFLEFSYLGEVPGLLKQCAGIKTAIMMFTLDRDHRNMVQEFAEERGLELVNETKGAVEARLYLEELYEEEMDDW